MRWMLLLVVAACTGSPTAATPPVAEFLVAAGDSTYWVRSGPAGIRVRSAPILLTRVEGRFYEVFIAEDGIEYADASFGSARVWSRALLSPDSVLLVHDSTVLQQAARWKLRHPRAQPMDPDEAMLDEPRTMVTEEIEIVDVHGPWLTFTHLLDMDTEAGEAHRHTGRRTVVDVRTGRLGTLHVLFGTGEAERLVSLGRASFVRLADSIRNAGDDRAALARETLDSFRFDSTSFAITDVARAPAVSFMVPGSGADGEALALYLPPIVVGAPSWWATVQPTLPSWKSDSSDVRWERDAYRVFARLSADGESLGLVLQSTRVRNGAARSAGPESREWPIATVASPAYQLIPLDDPAVEATERAALSRAFDMSTAIDGLAQSVSLARPSRRHLFRPSLRMPL